MCQGDCVGLLEGVKGPGLKKKKGGGVDQQER